MPLHITTTCRFSSMPSRCTLVSDSRPGIRVVLNIRRCCSMQSGTVPRTIIGSIVWSSSRCLYSRNCRSTIAARACRFFVGTRS